MENVRLVHVAQANWIRLRLDPPGVAFFNRAYVSLSRASCNQVLLGSSSTQLSELLASIISDQRRVRKLAKIFDDDHSSKRRIGPRPVGRLRYAG